MIVHDLLPPHSPLATLCQQPSRRQTVKLQPPLRCILSRWSIHTDARYSTFAPFRCIEECPGFDVVCGVALPGVTTWQSARLRRSVRSAGHTMGLRGVRCRSATSLLLTPAARKTWRPEFTPNSTFLEGARRASDDPEDQVCMRAKMLQALPIPPWERTYKYLLASMPCISTIVEEQARAEGTVCGGGVYGHANVSCSALL